MKIFKRLISLLICVVMLLPVFCVFAVSAEETELTLEHAKAAYLYNIEHGIVLFEEGMNERVAPTATVKMMVAMLAIEHFGNRLDEKVTLTAKMLKDVMGNNIDLVEGETVTYRDLIAATLVGGANDAATALAVCIDGSVSAFTGRMNARAVTLGATNTNYTNASGMHDDAMYTTCADTVKIAKEAYKNSVYMEYSSLERYIMPATNKTPERTIHNKNALISRAQETKYYYKYARGLSSGYTKQGGYCLATTASYAGATYLCVVMGAESDENNIYSYLQATKMFRYAFSNYGYREVLAEGELIAEMPVTLSDGVDFVACRAKESVSCYMPYAEDIKYTVTKTVKLESDSLEAPIEEGQRVGMVTLMYNDEIIGNVDLVASSSIARSEFLYALERIEDFVSSRFFIATIVSAIILFIGYVFMNSVIRYRKGQKHR